MFCNLLHPFSTCELRARSARYREIPADLHVQPTLHVIVDDTGAVVLLWDEDHQAEPEARDAVYVGPWEDIAALADN